MQLTDLPEEVLIIILRKLDICSIQNLYNACMRFRSIVCLHGVIKQCCMSRTTMGTVNTLKLNFFKDISHSLVELNMCGIPDLNRTAVIPAMKKLKQLQILDVSFTNIDILDLLEIHKVCQDLKDITINLQCGQYGIITKDISLKCQSMFELFINVHFVGTCVNLYTSKFVQFILAKSKLHNLKYTCMENCSSFVINDSLIFDGDRPRSKLPDSFNQFIAFFTNWKDKRTALTFSRYSDFPVLQLFNWEKYEYVVLLLEKFEPEVYASPIFHSFFTERYNATVECLTLDINVAANTIIMLWNKATTTFNDIFYQNVTKDLRYYLPCHFHLGCEIPLFEQEWYYIKPFEQNLEKPDYIIKNKGCKRVALPKYIMDYDDIFKEKEYFELTLVFKQIVSNAMTLRDECEYLRKLTYLSFINLRRHSSDVFNILFRCCVNLKTLVVEGFAIPQCAPLIIRTLPQSKSLRNLRLVDRGIKFIPLFISFTQCPTLENIQVIDGSMIRSDMANPDILIEKCPQLYSLYLQAEISFNTRKKILHSVRTAKKLYNKPYIHVGVKSTSNTSYAEECYDTFNDIFRYAPIRPYSS